MQSFEKMQNQASNSSSPLASQYRRTIKNVSYEMANNIDFVINLLLEPKESAIFKISQMIDLVDQDSVRPVYLKTFPVYFCYAETNKICVQRVFEIIKKVQVHPLFRKYKCLFVEWEARFHSLLPTKENPTKKMDISINRASSEFKNLLGYSDLEFFVVLQKWIKFHKLHKYTYFFANLSYTQFENLNEKNIDDIEKKINLLPITAGARGTIIRRMEDELKNRVEKLENFLKIRQYDAENISNCLLYLKKVFHTPINKKSHLSNLLEAVVTQVLETILNGEEIRKNAELAIKVLQSAYSCPFFGHVQKAKFNTLRCRLKSIAKEMEEISDLPNFGGENYEIMTRPAPTEEELLMINLAAIEKALLQMIDS